METARGFRASQLFGTVPQYVRSCAEKVRSMPTARIKASDSHTILRAQLDAVIAEPLPPEWIETLRRLDEKERQQTGDESGHSDDS